jgi:antitoxin component YwqK of YwqJK toxin-antitoxin module
MKFFIFLFTLSIFFHFSSGAQTDSLIYYFDEHLKSVDADTATYIEMAVRNKSVNEFWNAVIVNLKTQHLVLRRAYSDSMLSIAEGKFEIYDDNGAKTSSGYYYHGKQNGLWLSWDEEGAISDSTFFNNDTITTSVHLDYHNDELISRIYKNNLTNEKAVYSYSDNMLSAEMHFINGNKSEIDKGYYPNGQTKYILIKKKQSITDEKYYDEDGNEITKKEYDKNIQLVDFPVPEFDGGMNEFMRYISSAVRRHNALKDEINFIKEITIIFYLDSTGKPYNVRLSYSESMELTKTIDDAMNNMPRWKMNGLKTFGPMQRTIRFIF